jgi:hypothetical protein
VQQGLGIVQRSLHVLLRIGKRRGADVLGAGAHGGRALLNRTGGLCWAVLSPVARLIPDASPCAGMTALPTSSGSQSDPCDRFGLPFADAQREGREMVELDRVKVIPPSATQATAQPWTCPAPQAILMIR